MQGPTTAIQFYDCSRCSGFGYEVTNARNHLRCKVCNDNPSMYGMLNKRIIYWGASISKQGIRNRKARRTFNLLLNASLFIIFLLGIASLIWAIVLNQQDYNDFLFALTTPLTRVGVFWIGITALLFMYYRLQRESASKKEIDYSGKHLQHTDDLSKRFKVPANPKWESFHKMPMRHKDDISDYATQPFVKSLEEAYSVTKQLGHHVITPLHILVALFDASAIKIIMARLGLSQNDMITRIGNAMANEGLEVGRGVDMGLEAHRMLLLAYEEARKRNRPYIDVTELFEAIVRHDRYANDIFYDLEIDHQMIEQTVEWIYIKKRLRDRYTQWRRKSSNKPKGIMNRAMTARPSPLLQQLSQDYTSLAARGGFFPLIGRQSEMDQVLRIMRERTGHVLLVGPPGVGKSTLMEGLAEIMASEDVPGELQDKRLVVLDPGAIVADAQGVGAIEGRVQTVINEIARAGNIVLGVEDIHHLVNMRSTTGSEDAAGILMNAMSQGVVKIIATTTTAEYQQFIATRPTLMRRFQVVQVNEMTKEDATLVLEAKAGSIEYKYKTFFTYASLKEAVQLTTQFMPDRHLPAKALDVIQEVGAYVQGTKGDNSIVLKDDVAAVIAQKTNVQVTSITADERQKLLNLEGLMHQRVVGQDEAITAIASALRRARQGLRDQSRPISNLLFVGPTGVGKTETAKTIAEVYFGNEENMIRFDMSEYQDASAIRKLIGGKGEQGAITEAIRLKPFSIILLDELEKADPGVLNIFLQVMEDGRLTDGTGQTFDLSNTMIIATSNAGTQQIQNGIAAGADMQMLKDQLLNETLSQYFRPEFLNRFDNVIVFTPLTVDEVTEVARRLLARVSANVLEQQGITVEFEEAAIQEIGQKGYNPIYGARPLRRLIQDTVDDGIARLLLEQKVGRRDTLVFKPGGQVAIQRADQLSE